jgi:hypothetical protein
MVRRVDIGQMTRQHTERLSRMRRAMLKNTKFILHELLRETTTNIYDTCGKRCSRERLQCIAIESLSASNTGTAHLFDRGVSRTTTEGVWGPQELANLKVHGYGKPLQAIASHRGRTWLLPTRLYRHAISPECCAAVRLHLSMSLVD